MKTRPQDNWDKDGCSPYPAKSFGNTDATAPSMDTRKDYPSFRSRPARDQQEHEPWQRPPYSAHSVSQPKSPTAAYNQSSTSLSSVGSSAHFRRLQELLQDIDQDEEQRLAQIQREPGLLLDQHAGYQSSWTNTNSGRPTLELPVNRYGTINRRKSSPGIRNVDRYMAAGQYDQKGYIPTKKVSELQASNTFRSPFQSEYTLDTSRFAEMEAPGSIRVANVVELEVPFDRLGQPLRRPLSHGGALEMPSADFSSSFADVDAIITRARNSHASHGSSDLSSVAGKFELPGSVGTSSRLSKPNGLTELDGGPSPQVAELPGETGLQSPVERHNNPQQTQQWGYGHRKFRTLPGEAFPIMEQESTAGAESASEMKSSLLPAKSSNDTKRRAEARIDPRSGLPYPKT